MSDNGHTVADQTHERRAAPRDMERAGIAPVRAPGDVAGLLQALQRSAGNAAVNALLRQYARTHASRAGSMGGGHAGAPPAAQETPSIRPDGAAHDAPVSRMQQDERRPSPGPAQDGGERGSTPELTHVAPQRGLSPAGPLTVGTAGESLDQEAEPVAAAITAPIPIAPTSPPAQVATGTGEGADALARSAETHAGAGLPSSAPPRSAVSSTPVSRVRNSATGATPLVRRQGSPSPEDVAPEDGEEDQEPLQRVFLLPPVPEIQRQPSSGRPADALSAHEQAPTEATSRERVQRQGDHHGGGASATAAPASGTGPAGEDGPASDLDTPGIVRIVPETHDPVALAQQAAALITMMQVQHAPAHPSLILVVTGRLWVYGADGSPRGSFRLHHGASFLPRGVYLSGTDNTTVLGMTTGQTHRVTSQEILFRRQDAAAVDIARWADVDAGRLRAVAGSGPPIALVVVNPGGGSGTGTQRSATRFRVDPPEAHSTSEYEGGAHTANAPALPASITGPDMQATGGTGSYRMALDYSIAGTDRLSMAAEAGNWINYHWELYDITAAGQQGPAQAQEVAGRTRHRAASEADAVGAMAGTGRNWSRTAGNMVDDTRTAAHGLRESVHGRHRRGVLSNAASAFANYEALALLPMSAIVSLGGLIVTTLADALGGTFQEREIPWPRRDGYFLIRCLAQPNPQHGPNGAVQQRAASVAVKVVQVTSLQRLAREALDEPDTAVAEQQARIAQAQARIREAQASGEAPAVTPREMQTAEAQLHELQTAATGSAVAVIQASLARKQAELDAARRGHTMTAGELYRLQQEVDDLHEQLTHARAREGEITAGGGTVYRPRGTLISEVTGQSYPLLLQLGALPFAGGQYRYELSDVTSKDGNRYVGSGASPDAAVSQAIHLLADRCDYGRGMLAIRIPAGGPFATHEYMAPSAPRDEALVRQRLNDLVTVLMILGLMVPGVGEVAGVLGAALAADRLVDRLRNGTLRLDEGAVGDLIGVLGGVAQGLQMIGALRVARAGRSFVLAAGNADEHAMIAAARTIESGQTLASRAALANQFIGVGGLIWGNITVVDALLAINEQERSGAITHAAARRQRAERVSAAIRDNAMQVIGALRHGNEGPSRDTEEGDHESDQQHPPRLTGDTDGQQPRQLDAGATQNGQQPGQHGEGQNQGGGARVGEQGGGQQQVSPAEAAALALAEAQRRAAAAEIDTAAAQQRAAGGQPPTPSDHVDLVGPLDRTQLLSSAGSAGASAGGRPGFGVFRARIRTASGERDVVVKARPTNSSRLQGIFERELAGARAAAATGYGVAVHGVIDLPPTPEFPAAGKGIVMDAAPGGFVTPGANTEAARQEAAGHAAHVTLDTIRQVRDYARRLFDQGYYYNGEVQGFVDDSGHWRPIDLETVYPVDPAAREQARTTNEAHINDEITRLEQAMREHGRRGGTSGNSPADGTGADASAGATATAGATPDPVEPATGGHDEQAAGGHGEQAAGAGASPGAAERPLTPSRDDALARFAAALGGAPGAPEAHVAAENLVRAVGDWKGALRATVRGLPEAQRAAAEAALVAARSAIIERVFAQVRAAHPGVFMFNVGTVSFSSDIDITVKPVEQQRGAPAGERRPLREQLADCSAAALEFARLLRAAAGGETDRVIDTNVYSYIGEADFMPGGAPADAQARAANAETVVTVGFAEQRRGQGAEDWARFRAAMERQLQAGADTPQGRAARARLEAQLQAGEAFFTAREGERTAAERRARAAAPDAPPDTIARMAREEIVAQKRARLADLAGAMPPDLAAIARLQAEILWFEPDAYATRSAVDQAVGYAQSLRSAGTGAETQAEIRALRVRINEMEDEVAAQQQQLTGLLRAVPRDESAIGQARSHIGELQQQLAPLYERGRALRGEAQGQVREVLAARDRRGLSPDQELAHSAGAASANLGMMFDHIAHAGDAAARVKAAAKYGGRILLAEQLAGLGASSPATRVLLDMFAESRSPIVEGTMSDQLVREMLGRYAEISGMGDLVTRSDSGEVTAIRDSDRVRQAFVQSMMDWAPGAVARLQMIQATHPDAPAPAGAR